MPEKLIHGRPVDTAGRFSRRINTLLERNSDKVEFVTFNTADAPLTLVHSMENAMRLVWVNEVHKATTMICLLQSSMRRGTGAYTPDIFRFDMSLLNPTDPLHGGIVGLLDGEKATLLEPEEQMAFVAGHETKHRVDYFKGKKLLSREQQSDDEYFNSKSEKDADNAGVHALKRLYPNLQGTIITTLHGRVRQIPIPQESNYT